MRLSLTRAFRDCLRFRKKKMALSTIQDRAYAAETEENFRWLSSLLATKSGHVLTSADLVDDATHSQISDVGQYAEIAHGYISPSFVFQHVNELCQPGYPLESYDAMKKDGARLVRQFTGDVAAVQGYAAFRPLTRQLVVAFSGTSSLSQTFKDMQSWRTVYPLDEKRSTVHAGFWEMYQGVRHHAFEAVRMGFQDDGRDIEEIVLTGHSMGCVMCYLFALDLIAEVKEGLIPHGLRLNINVFGSPRLGNEGLARYWRTSIDAYCSRFGGESFREYSVKGYNDGAHTLPLCSMGFRHLTSSPLYLYHGRLYRVPLSECEHGAFEVAELAPTANNIGHDVQADLASPAALGKQLGYITWPKGGHNYYMRDMEKLQRRMRWLELSLHGDAGWQERYMAKLKAWEEKWGLEVEDSVP